MAAGLRVRAVVGVDAGGTKTDVVVLGRDGRCSRARGPGANHETIGWDAAAERLGALVAEALGDAGLASADVVASAWGLAGLDSPADERQYAEIVDDLGLGGPATVVNDAVLALEAGVRAEHGVALVSGTGTVALARAHDGRTARTFGVGSGRGDWGSGGDVVRAAAVAVAEEHLGTGPPTALTQLVLDRSGAATVADYVHDAWRHGRQHLAPPDVWNLAVAGDAVAAEIADRVAASLAAAARFTSHQVGVTTPDVVLTGRLLDPGHPLLHDRLVDRLRVGLPGCHVRRLGVAPVAGAAMSAARLAGWSPPLLVDLRDVLTSTTLL